MRVRAAVSSGVPSDGGGEKNLPHASVGALFRTQATSLPNGLASRIGVGDGKRKRNADRES